MGEGGKLGLCLTTVGDEAEAAAIARVLVEERLAACVSRFGGSLRSTYRWNGEIQDDPEVLLLIKAPIENLDRLQARVETLSSYEVPEFVVLEVSSVAQAYLSWVLSSCDTQG